jgi:hypothetical protein
MLDKAEILLKLALNINQPNIFHHHLNLVDIYYIHATMGGYLVSAFSFIGSMASNNTGLECLAGVSEGCFWNETHIRAAQC